MIDSNYDTFIRLDTAFEKAVTSTSLGRLHSILDTAVTNDAVSPESAEILRDSYPIPTV